VKKRRRWYVAIPRYNNPTRQLNAPSLALAGGVSGNYPVRSTASKNIDVLADIIVAADPEAFQCEKR